MQTADWHTVNININVMHQNTKCRHHGRRAEWNATKTHQTVFIQCNEIDKVKNTTEDMENLGIPGTELDLQVQQVKQTIQNKISASRAPRKLQTQQIQ